MSTESLKGNPPLSSVPQKQSSEAVCSHTTTIRRGRLELSRPDFLSFLRLLRSDTSAEILPIFSLPVLCSYLIVFQHRVPRSINHRYFYIYTRGTNMYAALNCGQEAQRQATKLYCPFPEFPQGSGSWFTRAVSFISQCAQVKLSPGQSF